MRDDVRIKWLDKYFILPFFFLLITQVCKEKFIFLSNKLTAGF